MGGRSFVHPLVDCDLTSEYTYQEIRESEDLGAELDAGNITITNDGEAVLDSTSLKLVQPTTGDGTGSSPSQVGGGAASMVMSFASANSSYVEGGQSTYQKLASFIYGGSNVIGIVKSINLNAWISNNGTVDVRLVCCGTGLVIAEITGINSQNETNVVNMGSISNLPTTADIIEVQGRKVTGGGASKVRIGSLELEY